MSTFSFLRFSTARRCLMSGLFILGVVTSLVAAPVAPKITKVDFSAVGFSLDVNGQVRLDQTTGVPVVDSTGNNHSYIVRWEDRSMDEEGFQVDVGVDNKFSLTVSYAANATEGFISPITGLTTGQKIQFSVTAWKFNGSKVEKSTSSTFTYTIPATTPLTLSTPTNLALTQVNDNAMKLSWNDASTSELYFQIAYRQVSAETTFRHLGYSGLISSNPGEQLLQLRLIPNTSYGFRMRATREAPTGTSPNILSGTIFSDEVTITTPPLTPPSELSSNFIRDNVVRLSWRDNSFNETGYEVQYRLDGSESFVAFGTVNNNTSSTDLVVPPDADIEWRVVAIYRYYPTGSSTLTKIQSLPSNTTTTSSSFLPPSNLMATTSEGVDRTIDLSWEDNTNSEYGFNIYTRPVGSDTYRFARAVGANVRKVSLDSRTESNDSNGKPVFIPLEVNLEHEFVVRAVTSDEQSFSADSNQATATVRDGFNSLLSPHIKQNDFFQYLLTTGNADGRTEWTVTGLPQGVFFTESTGLISGTPTVSGFFECPITATFSNGHTARSLLKLRVERRRSTPALGQVLGPVTVGVKSPFDLPLADKFTDPDAEKVVRLYTTKGNIDMILYPSLASKTVANFLSYVEAGDYNGMAFHRLIQGFVLQGGSLKPTQPPRSFATIEGRPAVENEPGITNAEGTIAAAKIGARNSVATLVDGSQVARDDKFGYVGNPDSATTDFFFNLENNNTNLDNQNSGFTVFGRLSNPSLDLVRTIAALPTGTYQNGNTTNDYSAALDKRILLDGSPVPWSAIPMDAASAPADMDIFKTVRVTKAEVIPNMTYSVLTNPPGIATGEIIEGNLRITGLAQGTTTMTVIATDLDGGSISQNFSVGVVKGYTRPVITRQPVAQSVNVGGTATFKVSATGSSLIYRWRKNGVEVAGQTGSGNPQLVITNVQSANAGLFDVQVKNATTSVLSRAASLDIRSAPTIGVLQETKLVEVGAPLTLQVTAVTGAPAPTFSWKKGSKTVSKQTKATLTISSAKLSDSGVYTATAANAVNKVTSNSVNVYVVDKRSTVKNIKLGSDVNLTAPVAGSDLLYRWKKDGAEIETTLSDIKGVQTPVLKITDSEYGFTGRYTCAVTLGDGLGTVETGPIHLFVLSKPVLPALTGNNAPPQGFIGVDYSWSLPFSPLDKYKPTSFSIKSLPSGLKYNQLTGLIYGRPTQAGVFTFSATASNLAGTSSSVSGKISISPLPAATVGTLIATISAAPGINANKAGRLFLTVTSTGAYTAQLSLGAETFSSAGSLGIGTGLFDISSYSYQSRLSIPRKNRAPLQLFLQIGADSGYVTGLLSDGIETVSINGFRRFWVTPWNPSPYGDLKFNLGLTLASADVGKSTVPQGNGYLLMSINSSGSASYSGRLADGSSITGSSILGPSGEAILFQMLYENKGSVLALFDVGDRFLSSPDGARLRVDGEARWIKDVVTASSRTYQTGIPETFLQITGANYRAPGTNKIVMGLPNVAANARLDFSEGGLSESTTNPDVTFRITTAQKVTTYLSNPGKVNLTIDKSTGVYSGSFKLVDGRSVDYRGLIIPSIPVTPAVQGVDSAGNSVTTSAEIPPVSAYGSGYFLMPELLPSLKSSKVNSGKAMLTPTPITITTQPVSVTLNPASTATFSVAVSQDVQGSISYSWRKNGTTIPNATSSSYSISNVTNASEGNYDCVITNNSYTVISNAATLSVNDPITSVLVSRDPSSAHVATSKSVTFTAIPNGSGPYTYQWRKDGSPIGGATSQTYTISSTATADTGAYSVLVINGLTPAGVPSNSIALSVLEPVTVSGASRTPAEETISAGTSVTFSVTTSTSGTLTYQWRKGGLNIPSATSATYTIESPTSANDGKYTVLVKNEVTSSGVVSPEVDLKVVSP